MASDEASTGTTRSDRALRRMRDAAEIAKDLRNGPALRSYAESVLAQLPDGSVQLVAASLEGVAAAAAVAVLRNDATSWRRIRLTLRDDASPDVVYVVEPAPAGAAWRKAILRRFPEARFIEPAGGTLPASHSPRRTAAMAAAAA